MATNPWNLLLIAVALADDFASSSREQYGDLAVEEGPGVGNYAVFFAFFVT